METRWLYRTSENFSELRKASCDTCVIPMGCSEKHGLHLPLGTDIIVTSEIAYLASQIETFCVFPDFTFGDLPDASPHAPDGTITLPIKLQMELLEVLCDQIARHGYKKILVYNGHGGNNYWLHTFARYLKSRKTDFVFAFTMPPDALPTEIAALLREKGSGYFPELTPEDEKVILGYDERKILVGHACANESAYMMGIAPHAVHLDRLGIESGLPTGKSEKYKKYDIRTASNGWGFEFPNAYAGHDHPEINERIGKMLVRYAAQKLAQTVKVYKEDDFLWDRHEEYQRGW